MTWLVERSYGAAARAVTTALTGANNDLVYTSTGPGRHRVRYVAPTTPSATLSVALSGKDITVNLATDGGTNEVQTLSITGAPTGGSFTLTYAGQTTASIAHNATATAVQAALRLLSNIGNTGVTCGGGPLPATPVTITFTGTLAATDVALVTTTGSFTGGSAPAAAVALTTGGVAPAVTSTGSLVLAAVNASGAAVTVTNAGGNTGAGLVTAMDYQTLV